MGVIRIDYRDAARLPLPAPGNEPVVLVQARMGSTRFPGKSMQPLGGRPLVEWVVKRAAASRAISEVVLATSRDTKDDVLADWAALEGIPCVRGPEHDVLSRFWSAMESRTEPGVVRITADCPLVAPEVIDAVVAAWWNEGDPLDYAANTLIRTFPDGLDVEVLRRDTLERIFRLASDDQREHVTTYVLSHPEQFRCTSVELAVDCSRARLTVDYRSDLERLEAVLANKYRPGAGPTLTELLRLAGCIDAEPVVGLATASPSRPTAPHAPSTPLDTDATPSSGDTTGGLRP